MLDAKEVLSIFLLSLAFLNLLIFILDVKKEFIIIIHVVVLIAFSVVYLLYL